jgi:hypothetical protein
MSDGWDEMFAELDALPERLMDALRAGMATRTPQLESTAKATGLYRDQTGATRASTIAFVEGVDDGKLEAAQATGQAVYDASREALSLPPRTAVINEADDAPDDPTSIRAAATAMMDYDLLLCRSHAEAHNFLGEAMDVGADALAEGAWNGLRAVLE